MSFTPVIPRESVELIPFQVTGNGTPILTGVQTSITKDDDRPTVWVDAVSINGGLSFLASGLPQGRYRCWTRLTSNPETPVNELGTFIIT